MRPYRKPRRPSRTPEEGKNLQITVSYGEFLELSTADTSAAPYHDSDEQGESLYGKTKSYKEALSLAQHGDPESAQQIKDSSAQYLSGESSLLSFSDQPGQSFDVAEYLKGSPDYYLDQIPCYGRARAVRAILNATVSSTVDAETIARRGKAIAEHITALELSGTGVELTVFIGTRAPDSRESKTSIRAYVKIKDASQQIDIDTFAFVTINPAFLRRIFTRWMETQPDILRIIGAAYGCPLQPETSGYDIVYTIQNDDPPQILTKFME